MSLLAGLSFMAIELTFHLGQLSHKCVLLIREKKRGLWIKRSKALDQPPKTLEGLSVRLSLQLGTRYDCQVLTVYNSS